MKFSDVGPIVMAVKFVTERLLPIKLRRKILMFRQPKHIKKLKTEVIKELEKDILSNHGEGLEEIITFLKENPLHVFPYNYVYKYNLSAIKVFYDRTEKLKYIMHKDNKVYFKDGMTDLGVRIAVRNLQIEQDPASPHRYLDDEFGLKKGRIAVDVGASEGLFAIDLLENYEKVFVFEADPAWVKPLSLTFRPYHDRIVLVNKFMDDMDDDFHCSFDKYFSAIEDIDLLKIDIDGGERNLLKGAYRSLTNSKIKSILICTYHAKNDFYDFSMMLASYRFIVKPSDGYMLYYYDDEFTSPYIRCGLIRAKLNE